MGGTWWNTGRPPYSSHSSRNCQSSSSASLLSPTGPPSATQLRPRTPYMMKLLPLGLNRKRLSPSMASQAVLGAASAPSIAASACRTASSEPSGSTSGWLTRRSWRAPITAAAMSRPAVARRKRGASASARNCHQRSFEYSTWR